MATSNMSSGRKPQKLHVIMFPWFAFGHFTPYLHLSNKLAQRGHRVSFLLPNKAINHLQDQNLHPNLITFYPITLPIVHGLPQGAETASDVPYKSHTLLAKAFDLTCDQLQALVSTLAPDFVFYDLAHWVPDVLALTPSANNVKAVMYTVVAAACMYRTLNGIRVTGDGFLDLEFGNGVTFLERVKSVLQKSDALCFRTCFEVDGAVLDCIKGRCDKPVLLTGPVLPEEEEVEEESSRLDPKWDEWLNTFSSNKVVFSALGSQIVLEKDQFQELVLGLEATGLPFLVVLKPPVGCSSIHEALPEGFEERIKGRGVVYDGWVQQTLILKHVSVGCFVCHCGYGSMWEGLVSDCQIVALPFFPDQVLTAEMLAERMKVAVVVKGREDNDRISKERLCEAIKSVMDEKSELWLMLRKNRMKYREVLTKEGFMSGYIDKFVEDLYELKNV